MATPRRERVTEVKPASGLDAIEMVTVKLPKPLPRGLKVVYRKGDGDYTVAATSKQGIKNLLALGYAGLL